MLQQQGMSKGRNRKTWNDDDDEVTVIHVIPPCLKRSNSSNLPQSVSGQRAHETQNELSQLTRQQKLGFYPNTFGDLRIDDDKMDYNRRQIKTEPSTENEECYQESLHQQNYGNEKQSNPYLMPAQFNHVCSSNALLEEPYTYDDDGMEENNEQHDFNNFQQRQIQGNNQNHFEAQVKKEHLQSNYGFHGHYQDRFESLPINKFETPNSGEQFQSNCSLKNRYQNRFETSVEQLHPIQRQVPSNYRHYENSSFVDNSGDEIHRHHFNVQPLSVPQKQSALNNSYETQNQQKRRLTQIDCNSSLPNEVSFSQVAREPNESLLYRDINVELLMKRIKELESENGKLSSVLQWEHNDWKKQSTEFEEVIYQSKQHVEKLKADAKEYLIAKDKEVKKNLHQKKEIEFLRQTLSDKNDELFKANEKLRSMNNVKDQFDSYKTQALKNYKVALDDIEKHRSKSNEYKKRKDELKSDLKKQEKHHKMAIQKLENQIEELKQEANKITFDKSTETDSLPVESTTNLMLNESIHTLPEVNVEQLLENDEQEPLLMDDQTLMTQNMDVPELTQSQNMSEEIQSQEQSLIVEVKLEEVIQEQAIVEESNSENSPTASQTFLLKEVKPEIIDSEAFNAETIQAENDEELTSRNDCRLSTVDEITQAMSINDDSNLLANNDEAALTLPENPIPNEDSTPWLAFGLSQQEYDAAIQAEYRREVESQLGMTEDELNESMQAEEEWESQRNLNGRKKSKRNRSLQSRKARATPSTQSGYKRKKPVSTAQNQGRSQKDDDNYPISKRSKL